MYIIVLANLFLVRAVLAGNKQPFFLYMAFQHTHAPQFAGKMFTNSSIRGTYGDALVSD